MSEQNSADVNEIVETLHNATIDSGETIATADDLRNLADKVPFYGTSDRDSVEGMPSLIGMWVKMFVGIEDAFHSTNEVAESTQDTNEIIRNIAKEISVAVHEYVSAASVSTAVAVTTTGILSENGSSTTGEGSGTGIGKLS